MADFTLRPLTVPERKYTYAQSSQLQGQTGNIGYLRGDFGSSGDQFYTTWFDTRPQWKSDEFKRDLDDVINALRSEEYGLLQSRSQMVRYGRENKESEMQGAYTTEFGFRADTEKYAFVLRCNPTRGDYNFYCLCYIKEWLDKHIEEANRDIRFIDSHYPWMLADVDYFVELPDGTTAILEIKTTNYNARDNWWMNGKETVPVYYESQGRHYMAVTDLDRCFFCCLYGNNEEEVIIREVKRDFEYEAEMVFLEQYFWENHVQRHVPPPYTESGALIIESARKHFGPADKNAPAVALDLDMTAKLMQYLRLLDEKKNAEVYSKEIDKDIQRLKALLIAEMGTSCTAVCEQEGVNYTVTYTPVRKSIIDKDNLLRLKLEHPDIYEQFVTVSESRRFSVRASIMEAA